MNDAPISNRAPNFAEPSPTISSMLVAHLPRLRSYAMTLTRNTASAEDLLQNTAYHVLKAPEQFTIGTNFTAWVYRILRNQFITSVRRSNRSLVPIDNLPEYLLPQAPVQEDVIFAQEVVREVGKLHPDQIEVLGLICKEGFSYAETAEATNHTIGTIKSRLWRARAHILEIMAKDGTRRHAQSKKRRRINKLTSVPLVESLDKRVCAKFTS